MHNVKRVHQSPEATRARKQKEQAKIAEYLVLTNAVLSRKKRKDYSSEAFELTTQLLRVNPEFYTVWNYRRNICLQGLFPNSSPDAIHGTLSEDLAFTMSALKVHPKVYWIWNHRRWCLENIPDAPDEEDRQAWKKANWEKELAVVEKLLDADPRNFQAWNYRRYVLGSMPVPRTDKSELTYTTRKIESNFSNFSAWHQRSKVYESMGAIDKSAELEWVRNAMYTDPDDQSVWIYHRWLMGSGDDPKLLLQEINAIQELLDEQPDSKWCIESMLHYKRQLLKKHPDVVDAKTLQDDCEQLLSQLKTIDPLRRQRYDDMMLV
ncbi:rab-protein geranylgeranyltransferase [Amanita rubescens]|nr:rab-protein geranylgeranyltransferase [Amanita rubescens]